MDALQFLANDHQAANALFEQLEGTYAKPANPEQVSQTRSELFAQLKHSLAAHCLIEERVLYPLLKETPATRDLIAGSYHEHEEVKRLLRELSHEDIQSEVFATLLDELKRSVLHHVNEEENVLFPRARDLLPQRQLADLGDRLQRELAAEASQAGPAPTKPSADKPGIINASRASGPVARPYPGQKGDGQPASVNPAPEPDMYKLGSQKESVIRKQHRESPGSRDIGRKGGSSSTQKSIPRAGRSTH